MFRNLEAEQARLGKSNLEMANILNVSRVTYENKKKTGEFSRSQITTLLNLFKCSFEYLFADDAEKAS